MFGKSALEYGTLVQNLFAIQSDLSILGVFNLSVSLFPLGDLLDFSSGSIDVYVPSCGALTEIDWLTLGLKVKALPGLTDIVRTRSCSQRDSQLITAYAPVSQPLVRFLHNLLGSFVENSIDRH